MAWNEAVMAWNEAVMAWNEAVMAWNEAVTAWECGQDRAGFVMQWIQTNIQTFYSLPQTIDIAWQAPVNVGAGHLLYLWTAASRIRSTTEIYHIGLDAINVPGMRYGVWYHPSIGLCILEDSKSRWTMTDTGEVTPEHTRTSSPTTGKLACYWCRQLLSLTGMGVGCCL